MYMIMDMGTSNTRLWLRLPEKTVCATGGFGAGDTKQKGKQFLHDALRQLIHGLLQENGVTEDQLTHILASGMATSELGVWELPHISLPADVYTLADNVQSVTLPQITRIPFLLVPGLKKEWDGKLWDIMRGEEVEAAGILASVPAGQPLALVLPGTHNKVILTDAAGMITDFYTTMSGEVLNNMVENTILSCQVSHGFELHEGALLRGAAYSRDYGLNGALFHIRVLAKNGMDKDWCSSFLYGCVLEEDCRLIRKVAAGRKICIAGRENMRKAYSILLAGEPVMQLQHESWALAGLTQLQGLVSARENRAKVLQAIEEEKLIAIVRAPDNERFMDAMDALWRGGVRLAEVTFDRSGQIPKAETAALIRQLAEKGRMLVGAGTVTTPEDVVLAYEAGASYVISPDCDEQIIRLTKQLGMVSIPAAFTPTEIAKAAKLGADYIKLFPADQAGPGYVKAVTAPLSDVKLLAVGGVDVDNAASFIQNGFRGVGVGAGLYNKKLVEAGDWEGLEQLARKFTEAVK